MNKVKVMTVFGTRPEAIKMAPLVLKLKKDDRFEEITVVSAQHREMLDQVLDIFKIKPDYDFNIMHKNQTLEDITSKVMLDMAKNKKRNGVLAGPFSEFIKYPIGSPFPLAMKSV